MGLERNELLEAAKNYLDITWSDLGSDKKLSGIIERGKKYIDRIAGDALNYDVDDKPKELLFDYVRYVRAGALDEFQKNYLNELLSLQIDQEVKRHDQELKDAI